MSKSNWVITDIAPPSRSGWVKAESPGNFTVGVIVLLASWLMILAVLLS